MKPTNTEKLWNEESGGASWLVNILIYQASGAPQLHGDRSPPLRTLPVTPSAPLHLVLIVSLMIQSSLGISLSMSSGSCFNALLNMKWSCGKFWMYSKLDRSVGHLPHWFWDLARSYLKDNRIAYSVVFGSDTSNICSQLLGIHGDEKLNHGLFELLLIR